MKLFHICLRKNVRGKRQANSGIWKANRSPSSLSMSETFVSSNVIIQNSWKSLENSSFSYSLKQEVTDAMFEMIQVVKMMMVVVTIFAVCWLPYHVYFIISWHQPAIHTSDYIQELYLAIYWLAMSNSMYNPIIYCWMNKR